MKSTTRKLLALAHWRRDLQSRPAGMPTDQSRILVAAFLRRERKARGPAAFRSWQLTVADRFNCA